MNGCLKLSAACWSAPAAPASKNKEDNRIIIVAAPFVIIVFAAFWLREFPGRILFWVRLEDRPVIDT